MNEKNLSDNSFSSRKLRGLYFQCTEKKRFSVPVEIHISIKRVIFDGRPSVSVKYVVFRLFFIQPQFRARRRRSK